MNRHVMITQALAPNPGPKTLCPAASEGKENYSLPHHKAYRNRAPIFSSLTGGGSSPLPHPSGYKWYLCGHRPSSLLSHSDQPPGWKTCLLAGAASLRCAGNLGGTSPKSTPVDPWQPPSTEGCRKWRHHSMEEKRLANVHPSPSWARKP